MRLKLAVLAAVTVTTLAIAHERAASKHTYNQHVRPIFEKHCGECHSPGRIGPMSLMRYAEATPWAASIRNEVLERTMPPWQPEEGIGDFRGARYLTAEEIEAIVDWATGGTPEGDPITQPAEAGNPPEWSLGRPNFTVQPPIEVIIGADTMERSECLELPLPQRPMTVRAIEFRPGNPEIVHQAALIPGADCSDDALPIATWIPGQVPSPLPPPLAHIIPESGLRLKIHYRKTWRHDGKEMRDRSTVGLYTSSGAWAPPRTMKIGGTELEVRRSMQVLSVYSRPEKNAPVRVEIEGKPVLQIDRFSPAWQTKYEFREPLSIPEGSRITVSNPSVWLEYVWR